MKWRVYKHEMRFIHNVIDRAELKDKACLKPHEHGFDPNPPCIIEFIVHTEEWIDFKIIKEKAIRCIHSLANSLDLSKDIPYYDFGSTDTETLTDNLRKLMIAEMKLMKQVGKEIGYTNIKVQIWLDETKKYSIWEDGE